MFQIWRGAIPTSTVQYQPDWDLYLGSSDNLAWVLMLDQTQGYIASKVTKVGRVCGDVFAFVHIQFLFYSIRTRCPPFNTFCIWRSISNHCTTFCTPLQRSLRLNSFCIWLTRLGAKRLCCISKENKAFQAAQLFASGYSYWWEIKADFCGFKEIWHSANKHFKCKKSGGF